MNYADAESIYCKLTASNDFLSQGACWLQFEAQYPPGSKAFADFSDGLQACAVIAGAVVIFVLYNLRSKPQAPPRRWIDRF